MSIDGVKIKNLKVHQDIPDVQERITKKGFLMEVLRDDDDLLSKFGQSTFTVAYKGTIKAFHSSTEPIPKKPNLKESII